MGKGGQRQETGSQREFTWDEVQGHSKRDDRWLVIDGQVYDVTNWASKHPGGSRLIGHYAGQDATEAFTAFHKDIDAVKKYLKPIHVGGVEKYKASEIINDFQELRETASKMGLFTPSMAFFAIALAQIVLFEVLAYYTLVWFGIGWIPFILSIMLISTHQTLSGWSAHDFGHSSVFKNKKLDRFMEHLVLGFMKGASSSWWNHLHFQHHAKPNVIDKDPDVRIDTLFVVGEQMPVDIAKTRKKSMPYNFQHRYFLIFGPPMLFPVYFHYSVFRHLFSRKLWMELGIVALYLTKFFTMYVPLLGLGWTLVYYFVFRCIESSWFTWVTQSNHIPMNIKTDESSPWLKLQLNATCDVEKSFFNDWFTGHLNFQIEHHLFPTMPRHNLYKVAPLVRSLCEKHHIPYVVKGLWESFADIIKSLKTSGALWEDAYREFQSD